MRAATISALAVAGALLVPTSATRAVTALFEVRVSPDTSAALGAAVVDDENVASDNLAGTVTVQSIGTIPSQADLDAYARRADGRQLLSFDTTVTLPGGVTARPGDVVRYDGAAYALEFDAAAVGLPDDANTDAVAVYGGGLLLSFDVTVELSGIKIRPADLVLFDGGVFSMYFDAAAAGVAPGLDLDAADYLPCNGHLLLSFDGSGSIGGVAFDDEDALEFDRVATWELAYDGSVQDADWAPADLDAIQAIVNLGPGLPAVFGQTVLVDADKTTFRWPASASFRTARGSFVSSAAVGAYAVNAITMGLGVSFSDAAIPSPGTGYWYLVKRGGCTPTSWQSVLGLEPGRDAAIP